MEDVTRKRIQRMLEALPEEQLYQVLDYIEFLQAKYARESDRKPDAFQQFAERVEDQMRLRSVAPKAMKGTMRLMSTAGRMLDGVREFGQGLTKPTRREPGRGESGRENGSHDPVERVEDAGAGARIGRPGGGAADSA
ncbi:MAG: hypothetical protein ACLFRX_05945 [Gemmatimonadota bacterium]